MSKPVLRFNKDGHFRILSISDFHGKPDFNPKLTDGIEAIVRRTEPDFVFICGDQLCNINEELLREYLGKVLEPIVSRNIPWAHTFGNHDAEQNMTKEEMERVYESMPLCLTDKGPDDISGIPNFRLDILAHDSDEPKYRMWSLDSFTSIRDYIREFGMDPDTKESDFILPVHFGDGHNQASPMFNQVMWYYNDSKQCEKEAGRKVPALMFTHVPVIEANLLWRNPEQTGFRGWKREDPGTSELNSGLFMACLERGDVKALICGHEHINVFSGEYLGITLADDGAMGYDMSCHDDLRGGRVIDLYENGEFTTRYVKLLDIMGTKAMRRDNFFEGADKYYIRDLHT